MQYIIGLGVGFFILYFLIIGGILIWPILNAIAYFKVLIFPWPVRVKYGTSISDISSESFDVEITEEDVVQLKNLESIKSQLSRTLTDLKKQLKELGPLKKNKDGTISQRSKAGKEGAKISEELSSLDEEFDFHSGEILAILDKPWSAWCSWSYRYARYLGNRDAIFFMIIGFPVFFLVLGQLNLMGLKYPTFENIVEIYIYITFVAPVSSIFDATVFKEGVFSAFISYDYAVVLMENYDHVFTLYNWAVITLPMPILTFLFYFISKLRYVKQAKAVAPNTSHWHC
jgi:hypothetical protein